MATAISIGFSRFAYALLLPPMRDAFGWSYAEAGALNTANATGYIFGAALVPVAVGRWGAARTYQLGLLASCVTLLLVAAAGTFTPLLILRAASGFVTAFAFIAGATLTGLIVPAGKRGGLLMGVYVAGAGLGIAASGLILPLALGAVPNGWRAGWLALGSVALVCLPFAWRAAAAVPRPCNSSRSGVGDGAARRLAPTIVGYGLFGAGYAGYMTFVVALLRENGNDPVELAAFWGGLGIISAAGTMAWSVVLGRLAGGLGMALVSAASGLGTLPLLLWPGMLSSVVTLALFGGSFMASAAASAVVARQQLHPSSLAAGLGLLTVAFALGQTVGPLAAGVLSDMTGSLAIGLWCSPVLLGSAAAASLLQGAPRERWSR